MADKSITLEDGKNKIISGASYEELLEGSGQVTFKAEPERDLSSLHLTTSHFLDGYKVTKTIEVITAECVFGMNVFRDMFAGIRDFVGGRSGATQKILRDARKTCLDELRKEADLAGANAVIAVNLNYSEFSGAGKSMLMLIASGTAVHVEKIDNYNQDFQK